MTEQLEDHGEAVRHVDVVLHHEHAGAAGDDVGRRGDLHRRRGGRQCRQAHHELGSRPRALAEGGYPAPVQLDQLLHDGEPDPEATLGAIERPLGLREEVEDAR